MDKNEEEFLKRLQVTFRNEVDENVHGITFGLIELEKELNTDKSTEMLVNQNGIF